MYFTAHVQGDSTLTTTVEAAISFDENAGSFTVSPDSSIELGAYWEITLTAYLCEPARSLGDSSPCPEANRTFLDDTIVFTEFPLDCLTNPTVVSDETLADLALTEFN